MAVEWTELLSASLPAFLPAAVTGIVAIYTIRRQSKVTLMNQELQLRMQARENKFEFYKSELIRAEERAAKAVNACGQLIGTIAVEDANPETEFSLSSDMMNYFSSSSAIVPITTQKLVGDLSKFEDNPSELVTLLQDRTDKLVDISKPLERFQYKEYAMLLAEVLHLQGQCYSGLMEYQALKLLDENELFPSLAQRLKCWFVRR